MISSIQRHAGLLQLVFVIGVVGSAVLLSTALRPESPDRPSPPVSPGPAVSIVAPVPEAYQPVVRLNGVVEAGIVTDIIPQVSGRVVEVSPKFRPGSAIAAGELLFRIDPADYELSVETTLAEIEGARSDLALLEAEAAAEQQVWDQQFPDRQIPDLIARVPQIAAAKARIRSGEAARRTAELSLNRTVVRAPFDARVLDTQLGVGQVVGVNAAVGTMFSLDSVEIAVPVSGDELTLIGTAVGRDTKISTDGGNTTIDGTVIRIAAALDERTRLGTLYVAAENAAALTVGEFVAVDVQGKDMPRVFRVPSAALTSRDQLWVVEDGRLEQRQVEVLGSEGDATIVAAFDPAEGVVAIPPPNGRVGLPVQAQPDTGLASSGDAPRGTQ